MSQDNAATAPGKIISVDFSEFSAPTLDDWRSLATAQLDGSSFEKKLVRKTVEGIDIQPLYSRENSKQCSSDWPGFAAYARSFQASGKVEGGWKVAQSFSQSTPGELARCLSYDVKRGLNAARIILDEAGRMGRNPCRDSLATIGKGGLSLATKEDLRVIVEGLPHDGFALIFEAGSAALPVYAMLGSVCDLSKFSEVDFVSDPFARLAEFGVLPEGLEAACDNIATLIGLGGAARVCGIDARVWAEAGASATQELGFAASSLIAVLRKLENRGLSPQRVAEALSLHVSVGTNVLFEVAKLRSARVLFSRVLEACGVKDPVIPLHGVSLKRNKTKQDPHVNMLRATAEGFAAVLGQVDSMTTAGYDDIFGSQSELSRRLARNTQLILRDEMHGNKVIDPAGGSWYVEQLTSELVEGAWSLVQEVEGTGGLLSWLEQGSAHEKLKASKEFRDARIGSRRDVIVGTNLYANLKEETPQEVEPEVSPSERIAQVEAFIGRRGDEWRTELSSCSNQEQKLIHAAGSGATLEELMSLCKVGDSLRLAHELAMVRDAVSYEQLRSQASQYSQKNGHLPRVFLFNMGPLRQHKARADFSRDFLEPGGFEVISDGSFSSIQDACEAAKTARSVIAVLCSTDETYPELVPEFVEAVKASLPGTLCVLAGYPADHIESFQKAGIDEFIHLKANNLALLKKLYLSIGNEN